MTNFDIDTYNSYAGCAQCGSCCELTVIAMTHEEAARIQKYIDEHNIVAKDQGPGVCPFQMEDKRCAIYPVRAMTCRLHSCQKTRREIIVENPDLDIPDDLPLVDMRRAFIHGDLQDPRTMSVEHIVAHYSG